MNARTLSIAELLDMLDWYRRCLEDVQRHVSVRGLHEAKLDYDAAYAELQRRFSILVGT